MHSELYKRIMNSKEWRLLRARFLTARPLCEECKRNGLIKASRCIHHIQPIEEAKTEQEAYRRAFDISNLTALCFECHSNIHKAGRSHSKDAHKERVNDNLNRWINKHTTNTNDLWKV